MTCAHGYTPSTCALCKHLANKAEQSHTILAKRDLVLESLRQQFRTKVAGVKFALNPDLGCVPLGPMVEKLLLDIANNVAQALGDE